MSCGRNRKQTTLPIIRRNRINKLLSFGNLGMYYVRKRTTFLCCYFWGVKIEGGSGVRYDHWRGGEKRGGGVQSAGRDAGIIGRWNWRIPTSATLWPSPSESFSKLNTHTHTDNCFFFIFSFLFFRVLFSVVFYLHFSFDWMGFAWPLHLGRFVV